MTPFPKPDFSYRKIRVRIGFMAAAGPIVGGLLSGVSGLLGGGAQKAAKKAANIAASQAWSDVQQGERAYEDQQPFRNLGTASANRLAMLMGLGHLPGVERRFVPQDYNNPFFNETQAPYLGFGAPGTGGSGGAGDLMGGAAIDPSTGLPIPFGKNIGSAVQPGAGSMGLSAGGGGQSYNAVSQGIDPATIRADQAAAMDLFQTDPGYQFRLDEGLKGVQRSAAAKGGALSGATMKGLERYGQGVASEEYGNYINRLLQTAGFGPVATNASGTTAAKFADLTQQARLSEGNARGSGYAAAQSQQNQGINNLLTLGAYGGARGGWFGGGGGLGGLLGGGGAIEGFGW